MCLNTGRFTMRDDLFRGPIATYNPLLPATRQPNSLQSLFKSSTSSFVFKMGTRKKKQISYPFNPTTLGTGRGRHNQEFSLYKPRQGSIRRKSPRPFYPIRLWLSFLGYLPTCNMDVRGVDKWAVYVELNRDCPFCYSNMLNSETTCHIHGPDQKECECVFNPSS